MTRRTLKNLAVQRGLSSISSLQARMRNRWIRALGCAFIIQLFLPVSAALAHDASETPFSGIQVGDVMAPSGAYDDAYNGKKIFLSSPRHADSGSRGECFSPGRQENENGRVANWYAANGNYYGTTFSPTSPLRNLHGRGYQVYVSRNTKDNNFQGNLDTSANWGSHMHIVTHTNAINGCNSSPNYLYIAYEHTSDRNLATELGTRLNPDVIGSYSGPTLRTSLLELERNAPNGDAYIELQMHDNQTTQSWLFYNTMFVTADYGIAVDVRLGYPELPRSLRTPGCWISQAAVGVV